MAQDSKHESNEDHGGRGSEAPAPLMPTDQVSPTAELLNVHTYRVNTAG